MAKKEVKAGQFNIRLNTEQTELLNRLTADISFQAGKDVKQAAVIRLALKKLSEDFYGR